MKNINKYTVAFGLLLLLISGTNPGEPGKMRFQGSVQQIATDYELIVRDEWKLEDKVKSEMANGWQPLGAPFQGTFNLDASGKKGLMMVQAMVKFR